MSALGRLDDSLVQSRTDLWDSYSGEQLEMRHGFMLELRPGCDYSRRRFVYRIAEPNEIDFLAKKYAEDMKDNWVCLDVGANVGYWTKTLVDVFQVKKVYAFEPDPVTYRIGKRNLENNSNVELYEMALGSNEGSLTLYVDPADSGDSTGQRVEGRQRIEVKMQTLDAFFAQRALTELNFLKVDIQGGEIDFFKGAEATIRATRPLIMVEIMSDAYDGISEFVANFANENEYEIIVIFEDCVQKYRPSELSSFTGSSNAFLIPC